MIMIHVVEKNVLLEFSGKRIHFLGTHLWTVQLSILKSLEWGSHQNGENCSFVISKIKDQFIYEEQGKHRIILKMMILLYNSTAKRVGINQIHNTYFSAIRVDATQVFSLAECETINLKIRFERLYIVTIIIIFNIDIITGIVICIDSTCRYGV